MRPIQRRGPEGDHLGSLSWIYKGLQRGAQGGLLELAAQAPLFNLTAQAPLFVLAA